MTPDDVRDIAFQVVIAVSLAINAVFLRRVWSMVTEVYDAIAGTPRVRGLRDEVAEIKRHVGLADVSEQFSGTERRHAERRRMNPRETS